MSLIDNDVNPSPDRGGSRGHREPMGGGVSGVQATEPQRHTDDEPPSSENSTGGGATSGGLRPPTDPRQFSETTRPPPLDTSQAPSYLANSEPYTQNSKIVTMNPYIAKKGSNNTRSKYVQRKKKEKFMREQWERQQGQPKHYDKFFKVKFPGVEIENGLNIITAEDEIEEKIGKPKEIRKLTKNALQIEVRNEAQAEKLKVVTQLDGKTVIVEGHDSMNTIKGTVNSTAMSHSTPEQLMGRLSNQGVIKIERMKKWVEGSLVETNRYIITFNRDTLPRVIQVTSYHNEVIDLYIPTPLRCNKCQKFGHLKKWCRKEVEVCANCGQGGHMKKDCFNETKCLNCSGNHAATDKKCPTYIFRAEVVATQTRERIPMSAAEDKVRERMRQDGQSYSAVVSRSLQNTQPTAPLSQPTHVISHTSDVKHTGARPKSNIVPPSISDAAAQEWHQTRRNVVVAGQGDLEKAPKDDTGLVRNRFEGLGDVLLESDIRPDSDLHESGGSSAKEEKPVLKQKTEKIMEREGLGKKQEQKILPEGKKTFSPAQQNKKEKTKNQRQSNLPNDKKTLPSGNKSVEQERLSGSITEGPVGQPDELKGVRSSNKKAEAVGQPLVAIGNDKMLPPGHKETPNKEMNCEEKNKRVQEEIKFLLETPKPGDVSSLRRGSLELHSIENLDEKVRRFSVSEFVSRRSTDKVQRQPVGKTGKKREIDSSPPSKTRAKQAKTDNNQIPVIDSRSQNPLPHPGGGYW